MKGAELGSIFYYEKHNQDLRPILTLNSRGLGADNKPIIGGRN